MGCPAELRLEADPSRAATAAAAARAEIERLEARYSHYRDDSLLGQLARDAGSGRWMPLNAEDQALFQLAGHLHRASGGAFDASAGPLLRLWDFRRAEIPDPAALQAARLCVGWDQLQLEGDRLRLPRAGMRLDFGGLVKEYAADRAAAVCRAHGIQHGLVDLGGDLAVIGAHADGRPWRIGIRDPVATQRAIACIELSRGGLASSGTYARMFEAGGRIHSHLLDARRGEPVGGLLGVSVIADDCLSAGAVATVALLLGAEAGAAWLEASGLAYLSVDAASPRQAVAVDHLGLCAEPA